MQASPRMGRHAPQSRSASPTSRCPRENLPESQRQEAERPGRAALEALSIESIEPGGQKPACTMTDNVRCYQYLVRQHFVNGSLYLSTEARTSIGRDGRPYRANYARRILVKAVRRQGKRISNSQRCETVCVLAMTPSITSAIVVLRKSTLRSRRRRSMDCFSARVWVRAACECKKS